MTDREIIPLWPDGPPTTIDGVPPESEHVAPEGIAKGSTVVRNVSEPSLSVHPPAAGTGNGVGVIVVPGGGWTVNMWTHEGVDVADWLTALGCTAFVLKYRVQASEPDPDRFEAQQASTAAARVVALPTAQRPKAIRDRVDPTAYHAARDAAADDGRRAIELVRAERERFGLRSLGMIGFSAGAFMIVDIALDPRAEQVDFIAPIYGGETRGAAVPDDAPPSSG